MKKLLKNSALLFGLAFLVLTALNWQLSRMQDDGAERRYDHLFSRERGEEVLVMGNSRAAQGISVQGWEKIMPQGWEVYNYAYRGATPEFQRDWYEKIWLSRFEAPKVVVFEIDWTFFSVLPERRKLSHDSEYLPFPNFIELLKKPGNQSRKSLIFNRFPVLKSKWRPADLLRTQKDVFLLDEFEKGHLPYVLPHPPVAQADSLQVHGDFAQMKILDDFLTSLESGGTKVILVQLPEYRPGRWSAVERKRRQQLTDWTKLRGWAFIDLLKASEAENWQNSCDLGENSNLYGDWIHLNREGALCLAPILRDSLAPHFH